MDRAEALARLTRQQQGHLATAGPNGVPHIVVVTFAVVSDGIVTAIDDKPKTTKRLKRITNLEFNPRASFLVDHYEDDWERLWWVRLDGDTSIKTTGRAFDEAIDGLVEKYRQYQERRPGGPVIILPISNVTWWESTP